MGVTSNKLYHIKNEGLRKDINKIGVKSDEELLLLEAPSEYSEVYRKLGVTSKQDFIESQLKDAREMKVFQDKYDNAEAFKGYHLKDLCHKYDLMVLPISNLKGYLNDEAMKAILDFTNTFSNTMLEESLLYILTGRENFYDEAKGKEVKTYIIFYKDRANNNGSSSRKLRKGDVINQLHSSGKDFSFFRIFNQLFLTKRYSNGEGMARLWSNLLISVLLIISILGFIGGSMLIGTIILVVYLGIMTLNNIRSEYKECWNEYCTYHGYYA